MKFKTISVPGVLNSALIPESLTIASPKESTLPQDQQHFLLYIPWNDSYLEKVPKEYQDFFIAVLPYLRKRTTDVHTAISLSYLDQLIGQFAEQANKRVVALALILHDSGWSQLSDLEIANSLGVRGLALTDNAVAPKEKHAIESEKIAHELLETFTFEPPLSTIEKNLIYKAVLYHDKPEAVAGSTEPMPIEVKILVDLDHLWSFTQENFWQDTVRKGVKPAEYAMNLSNDLDGYFVTPQGKELAKKLLFDREAEVQELFS